VKATSFNRNRSFVIQITVTVRSCRFGRHAASGGKLSRSGQSESVAERLFKVESSRCEPLSNLVSEIELSEVRKMIAPRQRTAANPIAD
jgi:hypothetical protein